MTIADTAARLLEKEGEAVTLSYEQAEVRDPATGAITTPGTTITVDGFGYPSRYRLTEVDDTIIKRSDVRLILSKVIQRPEQGWKANVQGKDWRVMDVQPITRAGADVIYICQLRV